MTTSTLSQFPANIRFFELDGSIHDKVCKTAEEIPAGARFRLLETRVVIPPHEEQEQKQTK